MAIKEFSLGFNNCNIPDMVINIWKENAHFTALSINLFLGNATLDSSKVTAELRYSSVEKPEIHDKVPATFLGKNNVINVELPEAITKGHGLFHCDINFNEGDLSLSTESFFLRNIEPPGSLMKKE